MYKRLIIVALFTLSICAMGCDRTINTFADKGSPEIQPEYSYKLEGSEND